MNVPQFAASMESSAEGRWLVHVFCHGRVMGTLIDFTADDAAAFCAMLNHQQERVHALVIEGDRLGAAAERARLLADIRSYASDLRKRLGRNNGAVVALNEWANSIEDGTRGDHTRGEQGR